MPSVGPEGYTYPSQYRRIGYGLFDEAERLDQTVLALQTPTLIFHGSADRSVPLQSSRAFLAHNPHATLRVFEGVSHGMLNELDTIWQETEAFFTRHCPPRPDNL